MAIKLDDRKKEILAEISGEGDSKKLLQTLIKLDDYTVEDPSEEATTDLIQGLLPMFQEKAVLKKSAVDINDNYIMRAQLQLALSQMRLFSLSFVLLSIVLLACGIALTMVLKWDSMRFLANASPLLGILTILYQFRANYNHMDELEAACPYTPSQVAAARLLVVLGYSMLLCLLATFFSSYGGVAYWQVVIHWLAPLSLTLGIALAASLIIGVWGGCLLATGMWAVNLTVSKEGRNFIALLFPKENGIYADMLCILIGLLLLAFAYYNLYRSRQEV